MTRIGFAISLFCAYVIQTGFGAAFDLGPVDLFLVLALLSGILMPKDDARLAACIAGVVQDLASVDAFGIHTFTLGLTGLLATLLRDLFNAKVWWVRGVIAAVAAWPGSLIYLLHLTYWGGTGPAGGTSLLLSATITALVAGLMVVATCALPGYTGRQSRYRPHYR